ncbi:D-erythronate dehydrogenase [Afifella marina]|uniref:Nucleoside-diphosphate-sugar epimerase n=1 Tax=Afifella marina DSM 2698 TaxID=1120955 RepID=A0A1G5MZH8_AFIMA|nr:D-erythronate dehydrogenase [Afifella marina]MBK1622138.1 NAD-dependent epimerase [Afifella marina DSM 2698]MBK5918922.1 NAD-dependent epimerase [Afifella marina]RAI17783.1 NAD-dependent epimerase [Afifella marina DSM 2698]SCZ29830.1 Nucleoside-diphosphate-sugar epimerase [Afifella marina DSM 2698]
MRILVLGAAGMVGRRLVERLLADKELGGRAIAAIDAFDVVAPDFPDVPETITVTCEAGDISSAETVEGLITRQPDVIFHLAAIVSGEAEADFDKGYRINLDGTRHLLEAIRQAGEAYRPRLVFTSSIAVFGAPFEEKISDTFLSAPLTSYGTQKAISELLLADYTRKGFVDGVGIRLPTIVVRPGKPNKAASGFFSGIIREPLAGLEAILPVEDDVRHWIASPAAAVGFLVHAATMDTSTLGPRRSLNMPGLSVTVGEMIATLQEVAGDEVVGRIRREPDEPIRSMVHGWPRDFDTARASEVGFSADADFASIIRAHIADEEARQAKETGS